MTPAVPAAARAGAARVVCVGGAVVDRHLHLHAPPVAGTSNPARGSSSAGGVARNVAENLALLGVPVRLVSRVGDDEAGHGLVRGLAARGVEVSAVAVVPGEGTAQYVAVLDPDGELVLGVAAMDVLDGLTPADLDAAWPAAASAWVLLDCNLPAAVLTAALRRAVADGTPVAVEAVSTPKVVRLAVGTAAGTASGSAAGPPSGTPGTLAGTPALAGIAVLFGNLAEAAALAAALGLATGDDSVSAGDPGAGGDGPAPEGLAAALVGAGARAVVLTLGARGAVVADGSGVRPLPARAVRVVDVTGAGDALVAATLAGLVAGADLDAAVRAGVEAATRTVQSPLSVLPPGGPSDRPAGGRGARPGTG